MIYNIAIIGSILFMLLIILLVRNKKLHEKYSILWLVFALIILILVCNHKMLDIVASSLGVYYAPALLFLVGFIVLIIYLMHLSVVITKQNKDIIRLTQELAITRQKMNESSKED